MDGGGSKRGSQVEDHDGEATAPLGELEQEIEDLKRERELKDKDIHDLTLKLADLHDEVDTAKKHVTGAESDLGIVRQRLAEANKAKDEMANEIFELKGQLEEAQLLYASEHLAFKQHRERALSEYGGGAGTKKSSSQADKEVAANKALIRDLQHECMHLQATIKDLYTENEKLRTAPNASEWILLLRKSKEMQAKCKQLMQTIVDQKSVLMEEDTGGLYLRPNCLRRNAKLRRRNRELRAKLLTVPAADSVQVVQRNQGEDDHNSQSRVAQREAFDEEFNYMVQVSQEVARRNIMLHAMAERRLETAVIGMRDQVQTLTRQKEALEQAQTDRQNEGVETKAKLREMELELAERETSIKVLQDTVLELEEALQMQADVGEALPVTETKSVKPTVSIAAAPQEATGEAQSEVKRSSSKSERKMLDQEHSTKALAILGAVVKLDPESCPSCLTKFVQDSAYCRHCGAERAYIQAVLDRQRDFSVVAWTLRTITQGTSFQFWKLQLKKVRLPQILTACTQAKPIDAAGAGEVMQADGLELCNCGNIFMTDSKYCRLCGAPRGGVAVADTDSFGSRRSAPARTTTFKGEKGVDLLLAELQKAQEAARTAHHSAGEWKQLLSKSEDLQTKCDLLQTQLTYLRAAEKEARKLADERPSLLRQIEELKRDNNRLQTSLDLHPGDPEASKRMALSQEDQISDLRSSARTSLVQVPPESAFKALQHQEAHLRALGGGGASALGSGLGSLSALGGNVASASAGRHATEITNTSELLASVSSLHQDLDGRLRRLSRST
eukprot:TRINITY_DN994_c0_g1_i1.p1 TRINITY_DN994_c0_g1~~TRINITY_DN994_c0_g1_i1.p1  ORF type:complete len:787 (-),score=247.75 TRINITY_DN994_c0_g1_i1:164-2524(-)